MLRNPAADADHLGLLVEVINRSYGSHGFDGSRDNPYRWIGHRLDEQPTKSFIGRECIPGIRLAIRRPEPPGTLETALIFASPMTAPVAGAVAAAPSDTHSG